MIEEFIRSYNIGLKEYVIFAVIILLMVLLVDQIIHFKPKTKSSLYPQMELDFDKSHLEYNVMPRAENDK